MPDIGVIFKSVSPIVWGLFALVIVLKVFLPCALKVFCSWWNSPERKGARGERLVARRLRKGLPDEYLILNDVYLPCSDETTAQIDHVVVSRYGIFVVETKNYSGWIFGSEGDREWTRSFPGKKSTFQNPIHQNYEHICALADNLGVDKSYFLGVVAFTGDCTFKKEMPEGVVYSRSAAKYIRSFDQPIIKSEQVGKFASMIAERQGTLSKEQIKNHVSNLKKRHS